MSETVTQPNTYFLLQIAPSQEGRWEGGFYPLLRESVPPCPARPAHQPELLRAAGPVLPEMEEG